MRAETPAGSASRFTGAMSCISVLRSDRHHDLVVQPVVSRGCGVFISGIYYMRSIEPYEVPRRFEFNLTSCETVRSKRFIMIVEFALVMDLVSGLCFSSKNIPQTDRLRPQR